MRSAISRVPIRILVEVDVYQLTHVDAGVRNKHHVNLVEGDRVVSWVRGEAVQPEELPAGYQAKSILGTAIVQNKADGGVDGVGVSGCSIQLNRDNWRFVDFPVQIYHASVVDGQGLGRGAVGDLRDQ